jgi:hypothetical protein
MKWKQTRLEKLEEMAYQNEQILLHAHRIIHLMPFDFLTKAEKVGNEIKRLCAEVANQ